jgi:hypothetical protein
MKCAIVMGSGVMIYVSGFMKTGTDVQAILRFNLSNLKSVMLVICAPLKWTQVA